MFYVVCWVSCWCRVYKGCLFVMFLREVCNCVKFVSDVWFVEIYFYVSLFLGCFWGGVCCEVLFVWNCLCGDVDDVCGGCCRCGCWCYGW